MPSINEIASGCKISVPTVRWAIKSIFKAGLISIIPQTRETTCGNRGTSVNLYTLIENISHAPAFTDHDKPKYITLLFSCLLAFLTPPPITGDTPKNYIQKKANVKAEKRVFILYVN